MTKKQKAPVATVLGIRDLEKALADAKEKLEICKKDVSAAEKALFERKCELLKTNLKYLIEQSTWKFEHLVQPGFVHISTKNRALTTAVSQVFEPWGPQIYIDDWKTARISAMDGKTDIHIKKDNFMTFIGSMDLKFTYNKKVDEQDRRDIERAQEHLRLMKSAQTRSAALFGKK